MDFLRYLWDAFYTQEAKNKQKKNNWDILQQKLFLFYYMNFQERNKKC